MVRLLELAIHPDLSQILDPGPLHPSLGGCVAGLCTPYSAHWGGGAERSRFQRGAVIFWPAEAAACFWSGAHFS